MVFWGEGECWKPVEIAFEVPDAHAVPRTEFLNHKLLQEISAISSDATGQ